MGKTAERIHDHDLTRAVGPISSDISDDQQIRDWSQDLRRFGIVTVTDLIAGHVRKSVRAEAERLLDTFAERRDLRLATTGHTRRSMSVVPSETIADSSEFIRSIYESEELRDHLNRIARERVFSCPEKDEEFLITRHEQAGDTHGWHWGDFSFALIWVLLAPPLEEGGLLQCVPHTDWDKSSPNILRYFCRNPIHTYHFSSGDVYFLRTDTTLHRTLPLQVDTTRIMLNMTFASGKDLARPVTDDDRWWDDAAVAKAEPVTEPSSPEKEQ